jgi:hypothetical protein
MFLQLYEESTDSSGKASRGLDKLEQVFNDFVDGSCTSKDDGPGFIPEYGDSVDGLNPHGVSVRVGPRRRGQHDADAAPVSHEPDHVAGLQVTSSIASMNTSCTALTPTAVRTV